MIPVPKCQGLPHCLSQEAHSLYPHPRLRGALYPLPRGMPGGAGKATWKISWQTHRLGLGSNFFSLTLVPIPPTWANQMSSTSEIGHSLLLRSHTFPLLSQPILQRVLGMLVLSPFLPTFNSSLPRHGLQGFSTDQLVGESSSPTIKLLWKTYEDHPTTKNCSSITFPTPLIPWLQKHSWGFCFFEKWHCVLFSPFQQYFNEEISREQNKRLLNSDVKGSTSELPQSHEKDLFLYPYQIS